MNGVGVPRRQYWFEGLIVFILAVAAVIGSIVRAKDAPLAPQAALTIPIAVSALTTFEGLPLRHKEPLLSLDAVVVNGKSYAATALKEIPVQPTDSVSVSGWSADRLAGVPANSIFVAVGSGKPVALVYGGVRPDVAKALGNPKLEKTGFVGNLPVKMLLPGNAALRFFVVDAKGISYDEVSSPIFLTVR